LDLVDSKGRTVGQVAYEHRYRPDDLPFHDLIKRKDNQRYVVNRSSKYVPPIV